MNIDLLKQLEKITSEEQAILDGNEKINKEIYMKSSSNVIDCKKLLDSGKLIQLRPHTRFVHFPEHSHNYVEMIYVCKGTTTHILNGEKIILKQGELLILNQKVKQEILPAKQDDIAVNFIILPEFFDQTLLMIGEEENLIRDFIIGCLKGEDDLASYLHFKLSEVIPIQNLLENLIWTIWKDNHNKRSINQFTMGLLFLHLMNHTDKIIIGKDNFEQELRLTVYRYIEEHYKEGQLSDLASYLHYDLYWLSRMIKKITNKNYTELVQTKRLNQATYLLKNTKMSVADIAIAIGYDNISYFHRIFRKKYSLSPKEFREK